MTVVTLLALLLSAASIWLSLRRPTTASGLTFAIALLFEHLAACVASYYYALHSIADSWAYYYDVLNVGNQPWGLSTVLVTQLTQILKDNLGATYFDCFLAFQTAGFAGIMLMTRTMNELEERIPAPASRTAWLLLFMPSLHFWTASIGKDALLLLAVALAVWAMLSLRRRFVPFGIALVIMVLFRAHIALMTVLALGVASMFDWSISATRKIGLLALAAVGLVLVIGPVQQTIHADVTSTTSLSDFIEKQSAVGEHYAGTTSIGRASFPVKLISLLFRPFFFDAVGLAGLISSLENVLAVGVAIYVLVNWRDLLLLVRRVLFIRFCVVFAAILLLGLALLYYNIGLGLRQRVMAYPMTYAIIASMWRMRLARRSKPQPKVDAGLMLPTKGHTRLQES